MSKFNRSEVRSSVAAALFAVVLSTVAVVSAVGPARAIETKPSLSGPLA